ncbi:peptide/nickel transport system permease protein [Ardenticatena maritima]|uniref:Peptide/nickel transport system permease protein n=1 Tax=Ardenticatena maritima TaxID=872965 RepID=A0A0M8K5W0_9CHLR|nr:oligopeptide ABC transporter permease [Ardenticatena maritima]KPL87162.1 hypothetical protein SE16_11530 [Ardenticatena maritima]GAP62375.1 peptide/nickel transport system permease protein [Ardenticatena maritima]
MAVAELDAQQLLTVEEESQWRVILRQFLRHRLAVFGLFVITVFVLLAVFAPLITPYDPTRIERGKSDLPPLTEGHWLGTDDLGRDMLARLLYAGRISLFVGFTVTLCSITIGTIVGAVSGYYGGLVDSILMRLVDFMLTLPTLPILLVISKIFGKGGNIWLIIIVLVAFGWMGTSRLVRGMVLSLKEQEFIEAERALGASTPRIIFMHLLPNSFAPIIVAATLEVGGVIITEAALSFLGFGIQPPTPTWGQMLQNVQSDMWTAPWRAFFPGFFIFMTSLSFNFIGDGLRDALDPRLKV